MSGHIQPTLIAALFSVCLAGCAGGSEAYPSLGIRDAERMTGVFEPASGSESPPTAPVASTNDIAGLVEDAKSSHQRFLDAQPGTLELIQAAQGLDEESNAHARALVALADLRTLHGRTLSSLGALDALQAKAATTFAPLSELEEAQTTVAHLIGLQAETLKSLNMEMAP